MPMTPKEMIKFLKINGFIEIEGGDGSHQKMYNPITKMQTVVSIHRKELRKGMEHEILRQAGLKRGGK